MAIPAFPLLKNCWRLVSRCAFVRNPHKSKAQELKKLGAELFVGNIEDIRDVRKSLEGVQRAYFVPTYPNVPFQGQRSPLPPKRWGWHTLSS
ncbi:MAG: NmrA family NAD(P)-binding protein [Anaerolineae bacterium]